MQGNTQYPALSTIKSSFRPFFQCIEKLLRKSASCGPYCLIQELLLHLLLLNLLPMRKPLLHLLHLLWMHLLPVLPLNQLVSLQLLTLHQLTTHQLVPLHPLTLNLVRIHLLHLH